QSGIELLPAPVLVPVDTNRNIVAELSYPYTGPAGTGQVIATPITVGAQVRATVNLCGAMPITGGGGGRGGPHSGGRPRGRGTGGSTGGRPTGGHAAE